MINAYEVAIKLKAEDQLSGALDKLIKYLGDASKKSTELEQKLERIGKLFKAVQEAGSKGLDTAKDSDATAKKPKAAASKSNALQAVTDANLPANKVHHAASTRGKHAHGASHVLQAVTDAKLPADKAHRAVNIKHTHAHGAAHAEKSASSSGGAAKKGHAAKAADGFVNVAGMGDAATSLNKLSKVLADISKKADKVSKVASTVSKVSKQLEGLARKAGFDGVANFLGKVSDRMNDLAEKAKKVAKITKILSQIAKVLADFAKNANNLTNFAKMLSKTGPLLESLGKAVGSDTLVKVGKAMKSLGGVFTKVMPVLQSFGQFFKSVIVTGLRMAGNAVTFLGRALMMTPIGLIVAAIAAAAYLLYKNWKTVGPYVMKAWAVIKNAFHVSAEWIAGKVQGLWNFVTKIFGWYVGIWVGIAKFIASTFSSIYDGVTGWLGKIIDWLSDAPFIGAAIRKLAGGADSAPGNATGPAKHEGTKHTQTVFPKAGKHIHVKTELHMDGKKVAETVTRHQTRAASRPSGGASCFSGNRAQRLVGAGAGH